MTMDRSDQVKMSRGVASMQPWTLTEDEAKFIEKARKEGLARPKIDIRPLPLRNEVLKKNMKSLDDELREKIRDLIDNRTVQANLSELDGCRLGAEVCEEVASEYNMRAQELEDEEKDL